MDMIAEILQTDKAAAGKLEKADMESGELLERTVKEAQELKENTYNLTRMNLVMRGILPKPIKRRKPKRSQSV